MTKTVLAIDGMMCGMCEAHINDAIRRSFNVTKVSSSHTRGRTEIISDEPLDESRLKSTIDETGYILNGITSEPYQKKGFLGGLFGR